MNRIRIVGSKDHNRLYATDPSVGKTGNGIAGIRPAPLPFYVRPRLTLRFFVVVRVVESECTEYTREG